MSTTFCTTLRISWHHVMRRWKRLRVLSRHRLSPRLPTQWKCPQIHQVNRITQVLVQLAALRDRRFVKHEQLGTEGLWRRLLVTEIDSRERFLPQALTMRRGGRMIRVVLCAFGQTILRIKVTFGPSAHHGEPGSRQLEPIQRKRGRWPCRLRDGNTWWRGLRADRNCYSSSLPYSGTLDCK